MDSLSEIRVKRVQTQLQISKDSRVDAHAQVDALFDAEEKAINTANQATAEGLKTFFGVPAAPASAPSA